MQNGFAGIVGQEKALERLRAFAASYRSTEKPPGHVLVVGPEGMGKRSIARAFATELQLPAREVQAADITLKGDFTGVLTTLGEGAVLLLTNVHRLQGTVVPFLARAMADFKLDITIEWKKKKEKRLHTLNLPPFTCVATAADETKLSRELREEFALTGMCQAICVNGPAMNKRPW